MTPEYRFGKRPGVRLRPVTKRLDNWQRVPQWLSECEHTAVDRDLGQRWLRDYQARADERVRIAEHKMAAFDSDERQARMLLAEDGKPPLTPR